MKKQIIIYLFSCLLLFSCDLIGPSITKTIKYTVTSTLPSADIVYHNSTGMRDTLDDVTLPWETSFSVTIEYMDSYYATVMAFGRPLSTSGSITVSIFVNGKLLKTSTGSSLYSSPSAFASEFISN